MAYESKISLHSGVGSPEGVVMADAGDMFASSTGSLYLKGQGTGKTGWVALPSSSYEIVFSLQGKPGANTDYPVLTFTAPATFLANLSGSYGSAGTNPTAQATYLVKKNGTQVGTIVVATNGGVTFTSQSGAAVSFAAGDRLSITSPTSQDGTLADVAITLLGSR